MSADSAHLNGRSHATQPSGGEDRPRVVMLLANEFTHDTRVFKEARSLIEWGCEVHVVALAKADLPMEETNTEIIVHRVSRSRWALARMTAAVIAYPVPLLVRRLLRWRPVPPLPASKATVPATAVATSAPPPPAPSSSTDEASVSEPNTVIGAPATSAPPAEHPVTPSKSASPAPGAVASTVSPAPAPVGPAPTPAPTPAPSQVISPVPASASAPTPARRPSRPAPVSHRSLPRRVVGRLRREAGRVRGVARVGRRGVGRVRRTAHRVQHAGRTQLRRRAMSVSRWVRRVPSRLRRQGVLLRADLRRRRNLTLSRLRRWRSTLRKMVTQAKRRAKQAWPVAFRVLAINHGLAARATSLRPDIIVSHDLNTLLGGTLVKRALGVPLVYDSHELYLERNLGAKSRAWDKVVWVPVEWCCIRECDAVMSVAESICRHLRDQYAIPKPTLIRNVQPFEPAAPRSRLLSDDLGIDADRPIVLYPGAITINRGLEVLIDSAALTDSVAYVIMGYARNPKYLASLRERAEQNGTLGRTLFFRDAVPIEDVVRYTGSADLGIVPTQNVCLSYFYESSNKIFHCLMAGVPLVMSDHAEKRMIVETYGVGRLFDETDPAAIARTVDVTLADRDAYDGLRQQCLAAASVLNWEHEEHKLRCVYAGLLGSRGRPVPPVRLDVDVPVPEITVVEGVQVGTA